MGRRRQRTCMIDALNSPSSKLGLREKAGSLRLGSLLKVFLITGIMRVWTHRFQRSCFDNQECLGVIVPSPQPTEAYRATKRGQKNT